MQVKEERVSLEEREEREKTLPFPRWRVMLVKVVELKVGDWEFEVEREMSGSLLSVSELIETDEQTR